MVSLFNSQELSILVVGELTFLSSLEEIKAHLSEIEILIELELEKASNINFPFVFTESQISAIKKSMGAIANHSFYSAIRHLETFLLA